MTWKAAAAISGCMSLLVLAVAVFAVVTVVNKSEPAIKLIQVPFFAALLVVCLVATANSRRHARRGDPDPTRWSDLLHK
jgi:peptidoglycan/LPS O-acetylase OafA/YrhL